ncbi:hypothetical protein ABEU95_14190, partial [Heyndrickxia faecalis]|uniref:hypothetical protein n=1 Tax=Heyndrickxia faecalis TaxID=2824910 RepID=UPI003D1B60FC
GFLNRASEVRVLSGPLHESLQPQGFQRFGILVAFSLFGHLARIWHEISKQEYLFLFFLKKLAT